MGAAETLELHVAAVVEADAIGGVTAGVAHGLADEDFATVGRRGDAGGHRDVAAEQVVTATHGLAGVDADPDFDAVGPFAEFALQVDAATHRLLRLREGDHEPVALALHDVTRMPLHLATHHLAVPVDEPDPCPVADS